MALCVCGSGREEDVCCAPYLAGKVAPTAEALMRSRYTAHVRGALDYLERTCAEEALKDFDRAETASMIKNTTWLGLDIIRTEAGGESDTTGVVEFSFHYKYNGQTCTQHEVSSFIKKDGAWLYRDSETNAKMEPVRVEHIGRNDPCPCGSGKKYKKCCAK